MAHPGPAEHPLRPRLIRWPTAAPLTDNEEIHHVPSSHLQDLRQDHLGRMRPTRRPGHGRHPQRRALPGPPSPRAVRRLAEQVDRALTPPASALTHRAQCRSVPDGLGGLRTAQPVPHVLPLGRSGAHALEPRPRSPLRHALAEATRWSGGSRLTGPPPPSDLGRSTGMPGTDPARPVALVGAFCLFSICVLGICTGSARVLRVPSRGDPAFGRRPALSGRHALPLRKPPSGLPRPPALP